MEMEEVAKFSEQEWDARLLANDEGDIEHCVECVVCGEEVECLHEHDYQWGMLTSEARRRVWDDTPLLEQEVLEACENISEQCCDCEDNNLSNLVLELRSQRDEGRAKAKDAVSISRKDMERLLIRNDPCSPLEVYIKTTMRKAVAGTGYVPSFDQLTNAFYTGREVTTDNLLVDGQSDPLSIRERIELEKWPDGGPSCACSDCTPVRRRVDSLVKRLNEAGFVVTKGTYTSRA